jgi:hypothetical protein
VSSNAPRARRRRERQQRTSHIQKVDELLKLSNISNQALAAYLDSPNARHSHPTSADSGSCHDMVDNMAQLLQELGRSSLADLLIASVADGIPRSTAARLLQQSKQRVPTGSLSAFSNLQNVYDQEGIPKLAEITYYVCFVCFVCFVCCVCVCVCVLCVVCVCVCVWVHGWHWCSVDLKCVQQKDLSWQRGSLEHVVHPNHWSRKDLAG